MNTRKEKEACGSYNKFVELVESMDSKNVVTANPRDDLRGYIEELCNIPENVNKKDELILQYDQIVKLIQEQSAKPARGKLIKLSDR
jgi:hypothetical protein